MSGPKIFLLTWFALTALITVATIGKERQPVTPRQAAIALAIQGGLAWLVVIA